MKHLIIGLFALAGTLTAGSIYLPLPDSIQAECVRGVCDSETVQMTGAVTFDWFPLESEEGNLLHTVLGVTWYGTAPRGEDDYGLYIKPFTIDVPVRVTLPGEGGYADYSWCQRCGVPAGGELDLRVQIEVTTSGIIQLGVESTIAQ